MSEDDNADLGVDRHLFDEDSIAKTDVPHIAAAHLKFVVCGEACPSCGYHPNEATRMAAACQLGDLREKHDASDIDVVSGENHVGLCGVCGTMLQLPREGVKIVELHKTLFDSFIKNVPKSAVHTMNLVTLVIAASKHRRIIENSNLDMIQLAGSLLDKMAQTITSRGQSCNWLIMVDPPGYASAMVVASTENKEQLDAMLAAAREGVLKAR